MDKLYMLTDLDGTLLRPDASLSELTVKTVTEAIRSGQVISYATARSYTSSQAVAGGIPWQHPLVLYNGALLYDPLTASKLDGAFLPPGMTNDLIAFGKMIGLCPLLFALDEHDTERVLHEPLTRTGDRQFKESRHQDPRFRETAALWCPEGFQTLILTYIGLHEELAPLYEAVRQRYGGRVHVHFMPDGYLQDHYFLEISDPCANKSSGLLMWAKHVGCRPEQVIVFGDNLNDIGLFRSGGTRLAVANAQPELKALADEVIEANADDGVARYILRRLNGSGGNKNLI